MATNARAWVWSARKCRRCLNQEIRFFSTSMQGRPRPRPQDINYSGFAPQQHTSSQTERKSRIDSLQIFSIRSFGSRAIDNDKTSTPHHKHRAYIALGSNLGDRVKEIEQACLAMESQGDIRITRTSSLWETEPMYVQDQSRFLNGACEITTSLGPIELLDRLQSIERDLGRVKLIDKGPRNIDLDILLFDGERMETERLEIPHKLMSEREFVLRPLCQIAGSLSKPPVSDSLHSDGKGHDDDDLGTFSSQLERLMNSSATPSTMSTYTPLQKPTISAREDQEQDQEPLRPLSLTRRTKLMSILNITPDSFSDGGKNNPSSLPTLKKTISSHLTAGATILDIGGESTRPGAIPITASEELDRIIPVIKLCKEMNVKASISVDTYRASVARAAIEAGADIINDIGGGTLDPDMFDTIAELGCTYVLMHMRGTPQTMTSPQNTTYPDNEIITSIARELSSRLDSALTSGIRRWRIILDPGFGFAKTTDQQLEMLRRFDELRAWPEFVGIPWLVGVSRKGFIGKTSGVEEPGARGWGTAVAVAAAVRGGADVVRVHDVEEMRQVVRMADGIWRGMG